MIIAGTGHRPNKLGGYDQQNFHNLVKFAGVRLVQQEPDLVVSGTALGWDMALLVAARKLDYRVQAAVPFEGFDKNWHYGTRQFWNAWVESCSEVVVLKDLGQDFQYYDVVKALDERNRYMVDMSDSMMALWNGTKGGTANCIRYAQNRKVVVENHWYYWERSRFNKDRIC